MSTVILGVQPKKKKEKKRFLFGAEMRGLMGCSQPDVLAARAMTLNEGNRAEWENYTPLLGNQYSREVGDLGEMNCGLLGTQSTMK